MNLEQKYSIIIPAYNEQQTIYKQISKMQNILSDSGDIFEFIIINDGSNDNTLDEINKLSFPIILINQLTNQGYGAALKAGIEKAKFDNIVITDADGTYPSKYIPDFARKLHSNNLDMIIGARVGKNVNIPLIRRPPKWVINKFAEWITGRKIPDVNSGLRIFSKSSFSPFHNLVPNGFSFTTTITLGMILGGYKVKFVPIDYLKRKGKSKIKPIRDTVNFFKIIFKIGLYFAPIKIFIPISLGLIIIAFVWGLLSKIILGQIADISVLVIIMTAFQLAALSLVAELINNRITNIYKKNN